MKNHNKTESTHSYALFLMLCCLILPAGCGDQNGRSRDPDNSDGGVADGEVIDGEAADGGQRECLTLLECPCEVSEDCPANRPVCLGNTCMCGEDSDCQDGFHCALVPAASIPNNINNECVVSCQSDNDCLGEFDTCIKLLNRENVNQCFSCAMAPSLCGEDPLCIDLLTNSVCGTQDVLVGSE